MGSILKQYFNFKLKVKLCCLVIFFPMIVHGEIRHPESPLEPTVNSPNSRIKGKEKSKDLIQRYSGRLSIRGMGLFKGYLLLKGRDIEIDNPITGKIKISYSKIDKFLIQEWKGDKTISGKYVFYPSKIVLKLKNGNEIVHNGRLSAFDKLEFEIGSRRRFFYSFFYLNSGNKKKGASILRSYPLDGTVEGFFWLN